MTTCVLGSEQFLVAPPEHMIPECIHGTMTTDRVCRTCNNLVGSDVEDGIQSHPLIRTAVARLGLLVPQPPRVVRDDTLFARLVAKIAMEFLGDTNYEAALEAAYDPWREFVLFGRNAKVILPLVEFYDFHERTEQDHPPPMRRGGHRLSLSVVQENIFVGVVLYQQIFCKARLPLPGSRSVVNASRVQSLVDFASKSFSGENREQWLQQRIVVAGKMRRRGAFDEWSW